MRAGHQRFLRALLALVGAAGVLALILGARAHAAGPTPITDCTNDTQLRADAATGGTYVFACAGTIKLTQTIHVSHDLSLDGAGHSVTIADPNGIYSYYRLFYVTGGHVTLSRLTLANASAATFGTDGAAGTMGTDGGPGGNGGSTNVPAQGGGVFIGPGASVTLSNATLKGLYAWSRGGYGGRGGAGTGTLSSNHGGKGGDGGNGSNAQGGAVYVSTGATLVAQATGFTSDTAAAWGGIGGNGGDGNGDGYGGNGGAGGVSGNGQGGAIYNAGTAKLSDVTFQTDGAVSGNYAIGGGPGFGSEYPRGGESPGETGGYGGDGADAQGGAIYNGGTMSLDCGGTFKNDAAASYGGNGGSGGIQSGGPATGGNGGNAGNAQGGAIYASTPPTALAASYSGDRVFVSPGLGANAEGGTNGTGGTASGTDVFGTGPGSGAKTCIVTLSGRLTESNCGQSSCQAPTGVADVVVAAEGKSNSGAAESQTATSDSAGNWSMKVPAGDYRITPDPQEGGWSPDHVDVSAQGDTNGLDFSRCASSSGSQAADAVGRAPDPPKRFHLDGIVYDRADRSNRTGLSGVKIFAVSGRGATMAVTDKNGGYEMTLCKGPYTVWAAKDDIPNHRSILMFSFIPAETSVQISSDKVINFLGVSRRLVFPDNTPVEGPPPSWSSPAGQRILRRWSADEKAVGGVGIVLTAAKAIKDATPAGEAVAADAQFIATKANPYLAAVSGGLGVGGLIDDVVAAHADPFDPHYKAVAVPRPKPAPVVSEPDQHGETLIRTYLGDAEMLAAVASALSTTENRAASAVKVHDRAAHRLQLKAESRYLRKLAALTDGSIATQLKIADLLRSAQRKAHIARISLGVSAVRLYKARVWQDPLTVLEAKMLSSAGAPPGYVFSWLQHRASARIPQNVDLPGILTNAKSISAGRSTAAALRRDAKRVH